MASGFSRTSDVERLKAVLDRHYEDFNRLDSATDPVHIVRQYAEPADREVVGFCAAALAFGRVGSVMNSIEALLERLGPHPASALRAFEPRRAAPRFRGLGHRWTRSADLIALLWILRCMLEESGSIEHFFRRGYDANASDVGSALDSFCERALAFDLRPAYARASAGKPGASAKALAGRPGVCYFFPRPSAGSGCKRLNLFLRWMVRRDAIDLGVWSNVSRAHLIVPLDTHVIRVGRCLGLTRYTSPGWKMAAEITASLRELDPEDPVRYDFSLCHLGMMKACGFARPQQDSLCPLRGICRP